jgi:hypothetical protein
MTPTIGHDEPWNHVGAGLAENIGISHGYVLSVPGLFPPRDGFPSKRHWLCIRARLYGLRSISCFVSGHGFSRAKQRPVELAFRPWGTAFHFSTTTQTVFHASIVAQTFNFVSAAFCISAPFKRVFRDEVNWSPSCTCLKWSASSSFLHSYAIIAADKCGDRNRLRR